MNNEVKGSVNTGSNGKDRRMGMRSERSCCIYVRCDEYNV